MLQSSSRPFLKVAFEDIPGDPSRDIYRQGGTLGDDYKHWFRAKFLQQFRLFFRYQQSADTKIIILAWVNDDLTLAGLRERQRRLRGVSEDAGSRQSTRYVEGVACRCLAARGKTSAHASNTRGLMTKTGRVDICYRPLRLALLGLEKNSQRRRARAHGVAATRHQSERTEHRWCLCALARYGSIQWGRPIRGRSGHHSAVARLPRESGGILRKATISAACSIEKHRQLRRAANALPQSRFASYTLLAKLAPFTTTEIELAKSLNGPHQRRVIMLTAREIEPYHLLERTSKEFGIASHGGSA